MGRTKLSGAKRLRMWRIGAGLSLMALGEKVSDPEGGQLGKFERGKRGLPLELAVRVADVTGIPISALLSPQQLKTSGQIRQLVDRDTAA